MEPHHCRKARIRLRLGYRHPSRKEHPSHRETRSPNRKACPNHTASRNQMAYPSRRACPIHNPFPNRKGSPNHRRLPVTNAGWGLCDNQPSRSPDVRHSLTDRSGPTGLRRKEKAASVGSWVSCAILSKVDGEVRKATPALENCRFPLTKPLTQQWNFRSPKWPFRWPEGGQLTISRTL